MTTLAKIIILCLYGLTKQDLLIRKALRPLHAIDVWFILFQYLFKLFAFVLCAFKQWKKEIFVTLGTINVVIAQSCCNYTRMVDLLILLAANDINVIKTALKS